MTVRNQGRARYKMVARAGLLWDVGQLHAIAASRGVRAIWLFGSAARGDARARSDIDLLVTLTRGRSLIDLIGVKQDLETLLGRRVDVFTRGSLKPEVLADARADLVRVL